MNDYVKTGWLQMHPMNGTNARKEAVNVTLNGFLLVARQPISFSLRRMICIRSFKRYLRRLMIFAQQ